MADRFESGRMEALSDGVFAIAITLLVLDISVPARGYQDLWAGIAGLVLLLAAPAPRVAAFGFLAVSHGRDHAAREARGCGAVTGPERTRQLVRVQIRCPEREGSTPLFRGTSVGC